MAVALKPVESFGDSTNPTNPSAITPAPRFGDIAAVDRSAPGSLFAPKTFAQQSGGNGSGTTGAMHAITPTMAGSTASYGFMDPSEGHGGTRGSGGINGGGSSAGGVSQLTPDQPIGIPPAKPGTAPEKQNGPSKGDVDAAISTENGLQNNQSHYTIEGDMNKGKGNNNGGTNDDSNGTGTGWV